MNRISLICVVLCATFMSAVQTQDMDDAETIITLDLSASRAHVGDNITIICRITNMPANVDMYWYKTVILDRTKPIDVDFIASGDNKIPPYTQFNRYVPSSTWQSQDREFILKINGVTEEDSGHIGCSVGDIANNNLEDELFEVYNNIEDNKIRISVNNTVVEDPVIQADAGESLFIDIEVGDSVPAAHVKVMMDEQDLTNYFSFHPITETKCAGGGVATCPVHFVQKTKGRASNYMFQPQDSGKQLVISAVVPGSGFAHVNKSFALQLQHKPIYKCQTHLEALIGQSYTLTCKVRAAPKLDYVYWLIPQGDKVISIDVMDGKAPRAYRVDYKPIPDPEDLRGTVEISLEIYSVREADLHEYTLLTGNEFDNTTVVLNLGEKILPEPSSAILSSSSMALLFAAFLSALKL